MGLINSQNINKFKYTHICIMFVNMYLIPERKIPTHNFTMTIKMLFDVQCLDLSSQVLLNVFFLLPTSFNLAIIDDRNKGRYGMEACRLLPSYDKITSYAFNV